MKLNWKSVLDGTFIKGWCLMIKAFCRQTNTDHIFLETEVEIVHI